MKFEETDIRGVIIIEPLVFEDHRGFFFESYHARKFTQGGIMETFVQDNHSLSVKGTLRGLHGQMHHPQGKLVRVIEGAIYDVAVDLRKSSPTFGRWVGVELSSENHRQMYIPRGFVHGFCVLSDRAQVEYKCTDFYAPDDEFGVLWNDPDIGIEWPLATPVISAKDVDFPRLQDIVDTLPDYPVR